MTFDELADTLPNGFHDAEMNNLCIDYLKREVIFSLEIWIGDASVQGKEDNREAYRNGELKLSGLLYCAIEPPDERYSYWEQERLWIDAGSLASADFKPTAKLPDSLPDGAFASWFFVQNWNSFIYVAAMEASLKWA